MVKPKALGRAQGGHADGGDRVHPAAHGRAQDAVDVAPFEEVLRVEVVGAPHEAGGGLCGDDRQQGRQVARSRPLADHDVHAGLQLRECFGSGGALVVAGDPGRDVGVEIGAGQPGRMTVDGFPVPPGGRDLGQHLRVPVQDPGEVHDLAQRDHSRVVEERLQVGRPEPRARGFQVGGRHARGQGAEQIDRLAVGRVQEVADPGGSQDVGDLVRVGHHRGGSVHDHGPGELADRGHGALYMNVGVDEPWGDDATLQVDHPSCGPVGQGDDPASGYGNAAVPHLAGEHVHDARAGQQQVAGRAGGALHGHAILPARMRAARRATSCMMPSGSTVSTLRSRTTTRPATSTVRTSAPRAAYTIAETGWCMGVRWGARVSSRMRSACLPGSSDPISAASPSRPGALDGRHAQDLVGRQDRRVAAGHLVQFGCEVHGLEQVEIVVAGAAVGPQPDRNAGCPQRGNRRNPRGELHVALGVVGHPRPAGGDPGDVRIVQPHPVREQGVLVQEAGGVEQVHGRDLVQRADALDLRARLGRVNLKEQAEFAADALGTDQRVARAGQRRVAKDGGTDPRAASGPVAAEPPRRVQVGRRVWNAGCREVDDPLPEHRAQADGLDRLGDRVFVEVAVRAGGRAGEEHLDAGKQGAATDGVGGQDRGLRGKDVFPQPGLERQVVGQAAEERHRQVGVGVDQPRHEDAAAGVDHVRGAGGGGHRTDLVYQRAPHPEPPRGDNLEGRVAGQDPGVQDEGVVHYRLSEAGLRRVPARPSRGVSAAPGPDGRSG